VTVDNGIDRSRSGMITGRARDVRETGEAGDEQCRQGQPSVIKQQWRHCRWVPQQALLASVWKAVDGAILDSS
jgi:hypothetical protein